MANFGTGPQRPRPAACAQLPGAPAPLAPGATAAAAARRCWRCRAGDDVVSGGGNGAAGGGDPKGRPAQTNLAYGSSHWQFPLKHD